MEDQILSYKAAVVAIVGLLTGLWGWMGWLVVCWVLCMVMDYITGSAAACKTGQWSSARAREGIWHKAGMIVVVLVASVADLLIGTILAHTTILALPVEYTCLICPVVLCWYIFTELGSITENATAMGAPAPKWLAKILAAGAQAADKAGGAMAPDNRGDGDDPV